MIEEHFKRTKTCPLCRHPIVTHVVSSDVRKILDVGDKLAAQNTELAQEVERLKAQVAELTLRAAQRADQAAGVTLHVRAPAEAARPRVPVQVQEDLSVLKLVGEIYPPGKSRGNFDCSRQLSNLDAAERAKYALVIQRIAFKNKVPDALVCYIRVDVCEKGPEIFLASDDKQAFEDYLRIFNLSLDPKESTRTTTNNRGEQVPLGVFIARTLDELEWALGFIGSHNTLPEQEHLVLQELVFGAQPQGVARRRVPDSEVKVPA